MPRTADKYREFHSFTISYSNQANNKIRCSVNCTFVIYLVNDQDTVLQVKTTKCSCCEASRDMARSMVGFSSRLWTMTMSKPTWTHSMVCPSGFPVPGNHYSTDGRGLLVPDLDQPTLDDNANEPYLDFLTYIVAQIRDCKVRYTTSYGEDEQSVPEQYSLTVCNMFGQLGVRGVSILFSSSDRGVDSACQTNDGKNTIRFLPIFPAACSYVTSVGGTHYSEPESAVSFSSSGGF